MSATQERRPSLLGRVVRFVVWCAGVGALAILAWLLVVGVSARTAPGSLETAVARTARHWAIPRAARALTNPEPQSPENFRNGLAHFADHCASCHANDGSGDTPIGRGLYPRAPDMRLPATQDLSDGELFYLIEEGIKFTGMPAWGTGTPDGERASWHLVQFIRTLPRLTPAQLDEMRDLNPRSPAEIREEEDMRRFLAGEDPPPPPSSPSPHGSTGAHR